MDRFSAHMDRAWDLVEKGQTTGALVSAQKALEIDQDSPEVHNLIGYIYALDGDVDEAIYNYRQAMVLDDDYIDPLLNTAELLAHPDADPEEAIRLCRNASLLISDPEEMAEAILLEVDALLSLGCTEEAKARLGDIENPDSLPPHYLMLLGRALYEAKDWDKAAHFSKRAIELDPDCSDAWYYLGLLAQQNGQMSEAYAAFSTVLELDAQLPSPPWAQALSPIEPLVMESIASLDKSEQYLLGDIELHVLDAPSHSLVRMGVDPRQVIHSDGINVSNRPRRLWVFTRNLPRAGIMPSTSVEELAAIISHEIKRFNT